MRKLSKKISVLMVLAMLVSLFSGVVSASAASVWSFKSTNGKFDVAVKETIIMEKNEYADFDLYKEGEKVTKATYTAVWESSDPDVVWVDATNGRLRADKFGKAEAGDKAMISATFTNVETKKSATRSFYIEIAADPVVEEPEYKIDVNFGDEAFVTGEKYNLEGVVTADGVEIEADVVFSIDGKAIEGAYAPTKAGDVTIVATATINGEEWTKSYDCIVVAKEVKITAIEQVELNKIRVIFNDAAFAAQAVAAANEDIEATFELTFNADKDEKESETLRVDHELYFVAADEANANCVYITMYKKLEDGLKYKLEYKVNDKVVAYNWVTGTGNVPASVEVTEKGYVVGDYRALAYVVKNDNDVIINTLSAAEGGFDAELYPVEWTLVSEESDKYDFSADDGSIYFLEDGAKATVKISIDMGYDDNANEIADLTDAGTVWGTDATDTTVKPLGYLVAPDTSDKIGDVAKYVSGTTPQQFFVGEGDVDTGVDLYLYAYYAIKDETGKSTNVFIENGSSSDPNNIDIFTYQSGNTDIVSVDEVSGQVYPVAVGTAKVFIKVEGKVIGYATVQVLKESMLVTFSADIDGSNKVSVLPSTENPVDYHGIWNQKVTVKETFKNQRGDDISADPNVSVSYELVSIIKDSAETVYKGEGGLADLFGDYGAGTTKTFIPDAIFANDILDDGKKITVKVKATAVFTCKDGSEIEKVDTFSFQIKNINGVKAKDPVFDVTSGIDMNLAKNLGDNDNLTKRYGSIKLTQSDAEGFFIREVPFILVDDATAAETVAAKDAESVTAGAYTVVVTKGDYSLDDTAGAKPHVKLPLNVDENTCTGSPCGCGKTYSATVNPFAMDGNEILKADKGSYKVRLYKGNGTEMKLVTTKIMKITDSTKNFTIQKIKENIDSFTSLEDLSKAIKFFSGEGVEMKYEAGKGLALIDELTMVVDHDYKTDDTDRVYIYSIKVELPVKAYNAKWADPDEYTVVTIIVDKTFTEK